MLDVVPEQVLEKSYDKRIAIKESGRQFVMNGHQIPHLNNQKPLSLRRSIFMGIRWY